MAGDATDPDAALTEVASDAGRCFSAQLSSGVVVAATAMVFSGTGEQIIIGAGWNAPP